MENHMQANTQINYCITPQLHLAPYTVGLQEILERHKSN